MNLSLPHLRLTGAQVMSDAGLVEIPVSLADGLIVDQGGIDVDLSGYMVLPGIIDLHGDAFERHLAPRPNVHFPMELGLTATDRDAAANGVTTAWLAQSWSWEGGHRAPEFALDLLEALDAYRAHSMTDLRVQLRVETHTVDTVNQLLDTVTRYGIDYAVFNNHLDEALKLAHSRPQEIAQWAAKSGRSAEEHMALVKAAQNQSAGVPRFLGRLAAAFDDLGVRYGSHDDPDGETRETYSMIGARICEFPTARAPAAIASHNGDPIVMGAPNVLRGGSQSGNIAAIELIDAGHCDALVSDYYYPALPQAAFTLVDNHQIDFADAWALISSGPAQIMRLTDRGRLGLGLRADLCILNAETRRIEGTISAGCVSHMAGGLASRFAGKAGRVTLAA